MQKRSLIVVMSLCFLFYNWDLCTDPEKIGQLEQRIDYCIRNEKWNSAFLNLQKILSYNPIQTKYLYAYIKVCIVLDKHQEAIDLLDKRINSISDPVQQVNALAWLGILLATDGEYFQAYKKFESCRNIFVEIPTRRSSLFASINNNAALLNIYSSALEKSPNEELHISFSKQTLIKSIKLLIEAESFNPTDSTIKNNLIYLQNVYENHFGSQQMELTYQNKVPTTYKEDQEPTVKNKLLDGIDFFSKRLTNYQEIVFVVDHSGSMASKTTYRTYDKPVKISRDEILKNTMSLILSNLTSENKIGAISVGGPCNEPPKIIHHIDDNLKRKNLLNEILEIYPEGTTPLTQNFKAAANLFSNNKTSKAIVLLSDGLCNCSNNDNVCAISRKMGEQGIDVFVISYLLENKRSGEEYLIYRCIAKNGELLGLTRDLNIEDKNLNYKSNILSIPIPRKICKNTCLSDLNRLKLKYSDMTIPDIKVFRDELFASF